LPRRDGGFGVDARLERLSHSFSYSLFAGGIRGIRIDQHRCTHRRPRHGFEIQGLEFLDMRVRIVRKIALQKVAAGMDGRKEW
jgi:hypothetical protein